MVIDTSLPASERLKSKVLINQIFRKGESKSKAPLRLTWLTSMSKSDGKIQIMVSVSKRSFPKAVDRNAIKRQLRNAYRFEKSILEPLKKRLIARRLSLVLLYTGRTRVEQRIIQGQLALLLENLVEQHG